MTSLTINITREAHRRTPDIAGDQSSLIRDKRGGNHSRFAGKEKLRSAQVVHGLICVKFSLDQVKTS